jgi:hypothetical protein
MLVYAASSSQPPLRRTLEELNDVEREIHAFFASAANVEKLVKFLSMEGNKGRDRFDARSFGLFKALFRNFGDAFLPALRPHLERLVTDSQESSQRFGCEMVAALVRSTKHWTYAMVEELWAWLAPLLRGALEKVTQETIGDWGTCFATASENRDPNRIHWMLELLMEEPIRSQGSFIDSSRLYMLQGGIAQQEWRIPELLHRLLAFLGPYLKHPYLDVRERIGSVLTNIFILDIDYGTEERSNKRNPSIADFLLSVLPELEILSREPDPSLVLFGRQCLQNGALAAPVMPTRLPIVLSGLPPGVFPGLPPGLPPALLQGLPTGEPSVLLQRLPLGMSPMMAPPRMGMPPHLMTSLPPRPPLPMPPVPLGLNKAPAVVAPMVMPAAELDEEKRAEAEKREVASRLLQIGEEFPENISGDKVIHTWLFPLSVQASDRHAYSCLLLREGGVLPAAACDLHQRVERAGPEPGAGLLPGLGQPGAIAAAPRGPAGVSRRHRQSHSVAVVEGKGGRPRASAGKWK